MGQLLSQEETGASPVSPEATLQAVKIGDLKKLRHDLKDGFDINRLIEDNTLLHFAVRYKQVESIKLLLDHGADPNITNYSGSTPIFGIFHGQTSRKTADDKDIHIIESLLKAKADINARNNAQRTPLFKSIINSEKHVTDCLLANNAEVNIADCDGLLPIHVCATSSLVTLLKKLLEHGADINGQDVKGRTALYYSVLSGHRAVFDELIRYGCDVNICSSLGCPLQVAVVGCQLEMVRVLLESEASAACVINESRFSLRKASDILNLALTVLQIKLTKFITDTSASTDHVHRAIAVSELIMQAQGTTSVIVYNLFFQHGFHNSVLQNLSDAKTIYRLQNVYQKLGFLICMSKQKLPVFLQKGVFEVDKHYQGGSFTLQNLSRMRVRELVMRSGTNVIAAVKKLDCSVVIKDILLLKDIFKLP